MPTDPFVPPDPSARPRQQQNLPPGIALPPAPGWQPRRPGDLGSTQPEGRLLGSPGPNVGYAYTLARRAADRLRLGPNEHVDDAVAVVAEIAARRAAVLGRAPVIGDVDLAMVLLGYDRADAELASARAHLVRGAAHDYLRRRLLVDEVPDELLRRGSTEAKAAAREWRGVVRDRSRPQPV